MSTREKVLQTIQFLSDEQIEGLYAFLHSFCPEEVPNETTLAAFAELDDMKANPDNYKSFTSIDALFEDLGA